MDPNVTLDEIRRLLDDAGSISDSWETELQHRVAVADELAEAVRALDEWLRRGGFLPRAWERK